MPRLSLSLIQNARAISPHLALLLRPCRDLRLAHNELRWLKEHALGTAERLRKRAIGFKSGQNASQKRRHRRTRHSNEQLTRESTTPGWRSLLARYVSRRGRGVPLQYIIGTQPFGDLDILCEPGVLVPRSETERIVERTAELIKEWSSAEGSCTQLANSNSNGEPTRQTKVEEDGIGRSAITILDLCTGTGCISLLLLSDLLRSSLCQSVKSLKLYGVDISLQALSLARRNRSRSHLKFSSDWAVNFFRADVLDTTSPKTRPTGISAAETTFDTDPVAPPILHALSHLLPTSNETRPKVDILISNPPYISPTAYDNGTTSRSVRRYEPKLALVPPSMMVNIGRGDEFYAKILEVAIFTAAAIVVFEVGDPEQAIRVEQMMVKSGWKGSINVWEIGGSEGVRAVVGVNGLALSREQQG